MGMKKSILPLTFATANLDQPMGHRANQARQAPKANQVNQVNQEPRGQPVRQVQMAQTVLTAWLH